MAKPASAPSPAADAAPAPAAAPAPSRASRTANVQSIAAEMPNDVIEWGNGGEITADEIAVREQGRSHAIEPPEPKVRPQRGEPDGPKDDEPAKGLDEPEPVAAKPDEPAKETPAEKRQRALDNLAAEKRARGLEAQLKETQGKLSAHDKLTLGEILAKRGETKDGLLEKLLTGNDGLDLPAKLEGNDAVLAELKTRLDKAEADLKARDEREANRQIEDATRFVAAELEGTGVAVIEALNAYGDVLQEAYTLWQKAGGEGSSREHIPQAAENVEKRLRAKNPRLAALADAAEKASAAAPAARALVQTRPAGITRRTAAQPESKPRPLPEDMHERDEMIKKEFGFR